jgi:lysozyme
VLIGHIGGFMSFFRNLFKGLIREAVLETPKPKLKLVETPKPAVEEVKPVVEEVKPVVEEVKPVVEEVKPGRDISVGIELIKKWEGLRLTTYKCSAGVDTIGWGSTGPHVKPKMTITLKEAEDLLKKDIKRFTDALDKMNLPLNDNQYSAVLSFCFNLGIGAFNSSTLKKLILAKDYKGAAEQFLRWDKARVNGELKVLAGLTKRRKEERELFLK